MHVSFSSKAVAWRTLFFYKDIEINESSEIYAKESISFAIFVSLDKDVNPDYLE